MKSSRHKTLNGLKLFTPLPFILPALIIYGLFALYPMIDSLRLSFYDWDGLVVSPKTFVGFKNYVQVFTQDPVFWTAVKNSLIWVILSLLIPTTLGLALAVTLNQRILIKSPLRAMFYLPSIVASIAVATMWSWMYNPSFGSINNMLKAFGLEFLIQDWLGDPKIALYSIFIAYIWQSCGSAMVLFLAGLQGIPTELKEAGRVDGANTWQVFWNITLPSLRPTTIVVSVLTIIGSLKVFDLIVGMTSGGPAQSTQVLALWSYTQAFGLRDFGNGMTISIILLFITLLIVVPYMSWVSREDGA